MSDLPPRLPAMDEVGLRGRARATAGGVRAGRFLLVWQVGVPVVLALVALAYAFGEVVLSAVGVTLSPTLLGWAQAVLGVLVAALLSAALANANVRAVLRYTFVQCLRTRIVAAFALLLGVVLAVLPLMMKGDGTLAGQIRTFLIYSTASTSVLLGLVTVFLSAGLVSGDVRTKRIFLLEAKPLARWQYLLGRWMGLVLLNVVLLAVAGGAVYGLAQHLRGKENLSETAGGPANQNDYRRVETEIFVARDQIRPEPLNVDKALADRVAALRREDRYEKVLETYMESKTQGNREQAEQMLLDELHKQVTQEKQSVPPMSRVALQWTFANVRPQDQTRRGQAKLAAVDPGSRKLVLRGAPGLTAHVVHGGPVWIDGLEAQAGRTNRKGYFEAYFTLDDWMTLQKREIKGEQVMAITIEPLIQLKYKATAGGELEDGRVKSLWVFTNPKTGYAYQAFRSDAPAGEETITVPAKVVSDDGRTVVNFINRSTASISILHADLAMLYRMGAFEWNFVRACLLMLLALAFLSALGLFAGSFVSFPVACLLCFCVLPYTVGGSFLASATRADNSAGMMLSHLAYRGMTVLLPDLMQTLPTDHLVQGLRLSWLGLARIAVATVAVRAMLVLALAWAIFRNRELARVQV